MSSRALGGVFVGLLFVAGATAAPTHTQAECTAPPEVHEIQLDHFLVDRDGNAFAALFRVVIDAHGGSGVWSLVGTDESVATVEGDGSLTVGTGYTATGRAPGKTYLYALSMQTSCGLSRREVRVVWPWRNLSYPFIAGMRVSADLNGDGFAEQVSVFDTGAADRTSAQITIRDGRTQQLVYDRPFSWKTVRLRARCNAALKVQIGRMSSTATNDVLIVGVGGSERCYRIIHLTGLRADVVFDYAPLPWSANDRNSWGPQPPDRGTSITPTGQDFRWANPVGLPPSTPRRDMFTITESQQNCPVRPPGFSCAIAGTLTRTVTYQYTPDQRKFVPTGWTVVFLPI